MTKKQKHLTLEDRIDIQTGISQQETFRSIAEKIGKDPSTISKEIKRNRIMHPTSVKSDCKDCPLLKKLLMSVTTVQKRGRIVDLTAIFTTRKRRRNSTRLC